MKRALALTALAAVAAGAACGSSSAPHNPLAGVASSVRAASAGDCATVTKPGAPAPATLRQCNEPDGSVSMIGRFGGDCLLTYDDPMTHAQRWARAGGTWQQGTDSAAYRAAYIACNR